LPRRSIGMSGFTTAHCRSFIQNSLIIASLLSAEELESDPIEPRQTEIGFRA
jgi:hypothetical protein